MTAGRGKNKITPEQLVEEFWHSFLNDRYEVYIGKAKLLNSYTVYLRLYHGDYEKRVNHVY
jgi:hypothetical protein